MWTCRRRCSFSTNLFTVYRKYILHVLFFRCPARSESKRLWSHQKARRNVSFDGKSIRGRATSYPFSSRPWSRIRYVSTEINNQFSFTYILKSWLKTFISCRYSLDRCASCVHSIQSLSSDLCPLPLYLLWLFCYVWMLSCWRCWTLIFLFLLKTLTCKYCIKKSKVFSHILLSNTYFRGIRIKTMSKCEMK